MNETAAWLTPALVSIALFILADIKKDLARLGRKLEEHISDKSAHRASDEAIFMPRYEVLERLYALRQELLGEVRRWLCSVEGNDCGSGCEPHTPSDKISSAEGDNS